MQLFDAHCHLQDLRLAASLDQVMKRAEQAEVAGFFSCGSGTDNWERLLALSKVYPRVIPAFGIHPWYIDEAPADYLTRLNALLDKTPAGVGEIGLDFGIENTNEQKQEAIFLAQLEVARERQLPVNIHCRKAWHKLIPLLKKYWSPTIGLIVHSFSGTEHVIHDLVPSGCYFSFSGSLTRSGNTRAHKAIKAVPPDRLLLETDAPDIPPVINHKIDYETPNEPARIRYVLTMAAQLLGLTEEEVAARTWENAQRVIAPLRNAGT